MVGETALNKEMKHLNGAYFRTNIFIGPESAKALKSPVNIIGLSKPFVFSIIVVVWLIRLVSLPT